MACGILHSYFFGGQDSCFPLHFHLLQAILLCEPRSEIPNSQQTIELLNNALNQLLSTTQHNNTSTLQQHYNTNAIFFTQMQHSCSGISVQANSETITLKITTQLTHNTTGAVQDLWMDRRLPPGFKKVTLFYKLPKLAVIPTFMMNFSGKPRIFEYVSPSYG